MNQSLILMRHAKSDWPVGVPDLDRPLSQRGTRNAEAAGRWIAGTLAKPDRIVVSTARRTRETWDLVSSAAGFDPESAEFDPRVYAASWWDLLDLVRETPAQAQSLMLIGHNPSMEDLAEELADTGKPEFLRQLRAKFPTSAVAVLTSDEPWPKWGSRTATLENFGIPR